MIRDGQLYCDECGGVIVAVKKGKPAAWLRGGKALCHECRDIWEALVVQTPTPSDIGRIVWLALWWCALISFALWAVIMAIGTGFAVLNP
jgi:hypothetical protein